jgi:hypothetical protein
VISGVQQKPFTITFYVFTNKIMVEMPVTEPISGYHSVPPIIAIDKIFVFESLYIFTVFFTMTYNWNFATSKLKM